MLLTSKSLQFLSVIPLLSHARFLSTGIFSSYVPKGLLHSSCPKRLSWHVLLLSGWLHIGSQLLSTLVRQKVLAVQKTKQNSIAMFILNRVIFNPEISLYLYTDARVKDTTPSCIWGTLSPKSCKTKRCKLSPSLVLYLPPCNTHALFVRLLLAEIGV